MLTQEEENKWYPKEIEYQPACYKCRIEAGKDAAGVNESSLCIPHLRARNAALEKENDKATERINELQKELDENRTTHSMNLAEKLRLSQKRNADLEAKLAALVEAAEVFRKEAVVLSADYLKAFESYRDDDCIQGWDKARWIRALDAEDKLKAAIAAAKVK